MTISHKIFSGENMRFVHHRLTPSTVLEENIMFHREQVTEMPTSAEIDAKIASAEARTDTKFAQVMGELGNINTRLDHLEKVTSGVKATVITTGIATGFAVLGLVVAVFGWGSQMFGTGMDVQSVSDHSAKNALQQVQPKFDAIDKQFSDLNAKIGIVLEAIQRSPQYQAPQKQ